MSDELSSKIKQIANMLSQEDMPDNIKDLMKAFSSSSESKSEDKKEDDNSELEENIEMMRMVKTVMDGMKNRNDPRVGLLKSVKPFLNDKRQKKIKNCIMLLQLAGLSKMLDTSDREES